MVYGPVLHNVSDAKALNNSSADIYRLIDGSEKEVPVNRFWGVADVRDGKLESLDCLGMGAIILTFQYSGRSACPGF
jgi:hypothetical protein